MSAAPSPVLDLIIPKHELARLLERNEHLERQVTELQTQLTAVQERSRERSVRAFHLKFGHPVATTPHVPSEEQVRFRVSLIAEEFRELLAATFSTEGDAHRRKIATQWAELTAEIIRTAPVVVDLPEFADALTDLDYVIEGTRAVFGINGLPLLVAVQTANMAKDPVYVTAKDDHHRTPDPKAKPTKPPTWRAPDIHQLLVAQGWNGFDGRRSASWVAAGGVL